MPNIHLKRFMPLIVIGALYGLYVLNGVNNFVMGMMDSSFHSGKWEQMAAVPAIPVKLPKTTYVCNPPQKTPWVGCSIQ